MKQTIHSVGSDFGQSTKRLLPSKQLMVLMVFMLTIIVDKHKRQPMGIRNQCCHYLVKNQNN